MFNDQLSRNKRGKIIPFLQQKRKEGRDRKEREDLTGSVGWIL